MVRTSGSDEERRRLSALRALERYGPLTPRQRNVLSGLLSKPLRGWRVLVRDGRRPDGYRVDVLLVGPGGVFGLVFGDDPLDEKMVSRLWASMDHLFADVRVPGRRTVFMPETAEIVLVAGPHVRVSGEGRYRVVSELDYRSVMKAEKRIERSAVETLAKVAVERDPQYRQITIEEPTAVESSALLDEEDLLEQERERARQAPLSTWMAFLDPEQRGPVTRNYNGPARIAGPAGTGKTVVALHRMAQRARVTTGKLLFTTFVRNLPPCQATAFAQLAPFAGDRARFMTLHAWAGELLSRRGRPDRMNLKAADNAFNLAWSRVGHHGPLERIEIDNRYWREEIDRVIKGRGLGVDDFEEYAAVDRRGRHGQLRRPARKDVWELYGEYEKIRKERGFLDANDLISAALDELARESLDEQYDMVVVDEVQDMSLQGLRLAHAIVGDVPNGLLLVGDGQQKVYAGGWRIMEAGIRIVGRGEVLKVNYRNSIEVLELAVELEGRNRVDDLDGIPAVTLGKAEAALSGGTAVKWRGSDDEVEAAIHAQLQAIQERGIPLGATALITQTNKEVDRFCAALRRWNLDFRLLENYNCVYEDVIKVGTVFRAKGLDFRAVLHPCFIKAGSELPETDYQRDRAELSTNQHFVAITRARDYAWLGVVDV